MKKKNIILIVLLTIILMALALTAGYLVGTGKLDKSNETDNNTKEDVKKEPTEEIKNNKQYTVNDSLIKELSTYIPDSIYYSKDYSKTPSIITISDKDMVGIVLNRMMNNKSNIKYETITVTNEYTKQEVCATEDITCGSEIKARAYYISDLNKQIKEMFGKTITNYPGDIAVLEKGSTNSAFVKYNDFYYRYDSSMGGAYQTTTKKIESVSSDSNTITINYTIAINSVEGNTTNKTLSEKFSCDNNENCVFTSAEVK